MAKDKVFGICLYCEEYEELKRSHTINRTFFSQLLKSCAETNAARVISLSSEIIRNSNDNWTDYLLCNCCESYFNQYFDGYGANALRGRIEGQTVLETKNCVIYQNIDSSKIILYILSLYWRGAKSRHPSYQFLVTSDGIHNYLKNTLKSRRLESKYFNVKISVLYDSFGATNKETIKHMMISPFRRIYEQHDAFSFCFLFEGFFIEIFFGRLRYSMKKKGEWLVPNVRYMRCEKLDMHSIEELHSVFTQMFKAKKYMELNNIPMK